MKPETYKLLDEEYVDFPDARAKEVPTINEIKNAEKVLGVSFHKDYIDFLLRYGAREVGAYPVYGLCPVTLMENSWSVVEETLIFRNTAWLYVKKWYVISNDGLGNPIGVAPDGKVMSYDHDRNQLYQVATDFEKFLLEALNFEFDDED